MTRKHSISVLLTAMTETFTSTSYIKGTVLSVQYIRSGATPISSTAGLEIKTEDSGFTILGSLTVGSASYTKAPRLAIVNTTNAAIDNESGLIPVADERISVTISASSAIGQIGTFNIFEDL